MSRRAIAFLAAITTVTGTAQQGQPPDNPPTVIRTTTQEVLLDSSARDKHQKLVTNLRQEDVEVLEDGVPQAARSFQYRGGREESSLHRRTEPRLRPREPGQIRRRRFATSIWCRWCSKLWARKAGE